MTSVAGTIMTTRLVTAKPGDTVASLARLLAENGVSAVPVCDPEGHVLGIVSESDLLRPFGQAHNLKRDWWLGLLADGMDLAPEFLEYLRHDRQTARDLMTSPVVTVTEGAPLPELADLLARHRVKRLPVVRDGRLVGIVSRADLVKALAAAPQGAMEEA